MFRELTCPSSGGQIVLSQHLVSSLSVNGCTVCQMRADSAESAHIWHTVLISSLVHVRPDDDLIENKGRNMLSTF